MAATTAHNSMASVWINPEHKSRRSDRDVLTLLGVIFDVLTADAPVG
jgi:hypothetical protein